MLYEKRYDRISRLPFFNQLQTWEDKLFMIIGIGGLGFHIVKALAMSLRRPRFILIDNDTVQEENLNRFDVDIDYLSKPKVDVAEDIILKINPLASVEKHNADIRDLSLSISGTVIIDETDRGSLCDIIRNKFYNNIYTAVKYDGAFEGTIYINKCGITVDDDDPYRVMPSFYSSAVYFANAFVAFLLSHDFEDIASKSMMKNITLRWWGND
jgi:hypothetical protein